MVAFLPRGFLGGQDMKFFKIHPSFVDTKKRPGFSPVVPSTTSAFLIDNLTLKHFRESPNQLWLIITSLVYYFFPYNLTPNSGDAKINLFSWEFFMERFPLYCVVVLGYDAFWYVALYVLKWSDRPFVKKRGDQMGKLIHDIFYSTIGVAIWVAVFENTFVYLWQNNKLPYLADKDILSSPSNFLAFFMGVVLMPAWRDTHFYFAHRLLHFRPIYTQVHSLHHRNSDVEPFSGLCMHPVEHIYYYTCVLPSLCVFWFSSPFHVLWNGLHLLLAPAASHSGFEDHFQADPLHYLHHRYFECNYAGAAASILDSYFGTFMTKFNGDEKDLAKEDSTPRVDGKANLRSPPTLQFVFYLLSCTAMWVVWGVTGRQNTAVSPNKAILVSLLAALGPVLLCFLMTFWSEVSKRGVMSAGTFTALVEPFAKKGWFDITFHLVVGSLCTALPAYLMCVLVF